MPDSDRVLEEEGGGRGWSWCTDPWSLTFREGLGMWLHGRALSSLCKVSALPSLQVFRKRSKRRKALCFPVLGEEPEMPVRIPDEAVQATPTSSTSFLTVALGSLSLQPQHLTEQRYPAETCPRVCKWTPQGSRLQQNDRCILTHLRSPDSLSYQRAAGGDTSLSLIDQVPLN